MSRRRRVGIIYSTNQGIAKLLKEEKKKAKGRRDEYEKKRKNMLRQGISYCVDPSVI